MNWIAGSSCRVSPMSEVLSTSAKVSQPGASCWSSVRRPSVISAVQASFDTQNVLPPSSACLCQGFLLHMLTYPKCPNLWCGVLCCVFCCGSPTACILSPCVSKVRPACSYCISAVGYKRTSDACHVASWFQHVLAHCDGGIAKTCLAVLI